MDMFEKYKPHAKRWLEHEYGECSEWQIDSLAYLLAGCFADGEMAGERKPNAGALPRNEVE
jgi:hypothetical protein